MNPEGFTNQAAIRIILAHYQLGQLSELTEEARTYIQRGLETPAQTEAGQKDKRVPIPNAVLEYLGRKLAQDKKFEDGDFFLTQLSTPNEPIKTSATIWKTLSECRMSLERYQEAIPAFDNYLAQTEDPFEKGTAFLGRGKAQLALKKHDEARESARECLGLVKQGKLSVEALMLLGDVCMSEGDLQGAVKEYVKVSQIIEDKDITPFALTKAINIYLSLGENDLAAELRNQLRAKYPDFSE
jgi:tetratricopeptide (TPR) repeat protein